mgnify:CR=1 FL=1
MHQSIDKKNKIVIYLIFFFLLSTISNKITYNQKIYYPVINEIKIQGLSKNKNIQIANELNKLFYKNIFFINKSEIINAISKNNIIEEYNIQKIYPSKLNINIKPTKFIAKIYNDNELLVGSNGKIIIDEMTKKNLPNIDGEFNSEDLLKFKKIIDNSKFQFQEFKLISFHKSRRWDILTNNDILIKLPKNDLSKVLDLAHHVIKNKKFKDNKVIDLRVINHLITE